MPDGAQALLELSPHDMQMHKQFMQTNCIPKGDVFCGARQPDKTNILLVGDSRVLDMYIALKTAYPQANIQASYAIGCPAVFSPEIGQSLFFPACPQFNQDRLQAVLEAPATDIVFLTQMLDDWRAEAVLETVKRLRDAGKTVYVLGDFDFIDNRNPIEVSIDMLRFDPEGADIKRYLSEAPFKLDGKFAQQLSELGAVYISNRDFFYDGQYHFTDRVSGKLLTFDGKHLNDLGARQFGKYLRERYPLR